MAKKSARPVVDPRRPELEGLPLVEYVERLTLRLARFEAQASRIGAQMDQIAADHRECSEWNAVAHSVGVGQ